ncbi:hypothetical protein HPP92_014629 [Vanilla planifolia]|uniref:Myb-like domain-containing protein n=1 Tax=Vanilla planifolia TaxID=51239 RepID=A0A835QNN4_VANPL|nr:hypothetical protein HPP92_014629 [Vanilla planifolia]
MGRSCCSREGVHKGSWTLREDALLTGYIQKNGEGNWNSLPKKAGFFSSSSKFVHQFASNRPSSMDDACVCATQGCLGAARAADCDG